MENSRSRIDRFESELKNRVTAHRSDFDAESMWGKVSPHLPKKDRKRRRFFILFLGVGLLFILVFLIFKDNENVLVEKSAVQTDLSEDDTFQDAFRTHSYGREFDNTVETKPVQEAVTSKQGDRVFLFERGENESVEHVAGEEEVLSSTIVEQKRHNKDHSMRHAISYSKKSVEPEVLWESPMLPTKKNLFSKGLEQEEFVIPEIKVNISSRREWSWLVSVFSGFHYSINKFSGTDESEEWATHREDSEKSIGTLQYGLRMAVTTPWRIGIESGISWVDYYEKLEKEFVESSVIKKPVNERFHTSHGDTLISDTTFVTTSTMRTIRHYNRRSHLSIPLGLNYYRAVKGWVFGGQVGVVFQLPQKFEGRSLTISGDDVEFWEEANDWKYDDRLLLSYTGRLSIGKYIGSGLVLSFEPSFSIGTTNLIASSSGLEQKDRSFGVNISLSKGF